MTARFELVLDESGKFHFQLRGKAGEVLLSSPANDSKIMAQNGVMHARSALRDRKNVVTNASRDGSQVIELKDRDGSVLARSAPVATAEVTAVVDTIQVCADGAPLVDATKRRGRDAHHA
jgi:uncharacterized protein YegP (UPF0339 family)